jgi:hypothetical protein
MVTLQQWDKLGPTAKGGLVSWSLIRFSVNVRAVDMRRWLGRELARWQRLAVGPCGVP